jgi:hypothetical protein
MTSVAAVRRPVPREDGGELFVNRPTRHRGTDYDPCRDFGRTPVRRRDLVEPLESLIITLEPVFRLVHG